MKEFFSPDPKEKTFQHDFQKGDHVMRWTRIFIYPIQVHGIVFSVGDDIVTIIDFGLTAHQRSHKGDSAPILEKSDCVETLDDGGDYKNMIEVCQPNRTERISILTLTDVDDMKQWKKVKYGDGLRKQSFWRWWRSDEESSPTTCKTDTSVSELNQKENTSPTPEEVDASSNSDPKLPSSDPANLVLARVRYLLDDPSIIPDHHILFSNSECIAVWCKTGRWSTLQASFFLHSTAAGNLKSTATLATVAGTSTVTATVPATGIAGWFGMTSTTTVSLLSAQPWLIPALAGYGIITIGTPIVVLKRAQEQWAAITSKLTDGFWAWADTDVYVEAIKHWNGLN